MKALTSEEQARIWLDLIDKLRTNNHFTDNSSPFTPNRLVRRILKKINLRKNSKKSVLVVYTLEFAVELWLSGKKNVTIATNNLCPQTRYLAQQMGYKYFTWEELTNMSMKFDLILGNPPFNVRSQDDDTQTGVSGKTNLFKDFVKKLPSLLADDGTIGFITPKGIINTLQNDKTIKNYEVLDFNLMSDKTYWKYDTCYWIVKESKARTTGLPISDKVLSNMLDLSFQDNFVGNNINKSDKELIKEGIFDTNGTVDVIRYLPGKRGPNPTYDKVSNTKYVVPAGPKVVGTHLNSISGILATNDPVCAGTTISYPTNSMAEAESLALFLKNNKAVKYFVKKTNVKKIMLRFLWFKKFDLKQIKTGYEYPSEWNLSANDIKMIEDYVD